MSLDLPDGFISGPFFSNDVEGLKAELESRFEGLQADLERIASLFLDTGGQPLKVRIGSGTTTWPGGSPRANNTTVNHGLGSVPLIALINHTQSVGGVTIFPVGLTFGYGTTAFLASAVTSDGSSPGAGATSNFVWIAVG